MPITITGNTEKGGVESPNFRKDLGYDYPDGLNLRPNSKLHKTIINSVHDRMVSSDLVMSKYRSSWEDIDRVLRVYISSDAAEGKNKKKKKSGDDYADLVIPESYATMETILTYLMSSFMQSPMIKYEGTGPEDVLGARLMTHVIDHQVRKSRMGLNLHTMFRDDIAYGFGAVTPIWRRQYGKKSRLKQFGRLTENGIFEVTREERVIDDNVLLYEGNELQNINPYLYFPDPTVAIHEPEKGEYQAWIEQTTKTSLLEQEDDPESMFFNVRYLKNFDATSEFAHGNEQKTRHDSHTGAQQDKQAVDLTWMYIDLIPKDWDLGEKEYPEKWLFGIAGDEVVISAQPVEYLHGRMPVAVSASNFDGYSATPVSRLSIVHDVQRLVNFLYTSHIRNVKKAINDMWVVDPSLINYYDLQNPEPGKIIRARRAAWGMSKLDQAVKQFPVNDVTRQHIGDANVLSNLMRRVSATGETLQGSVGGGAGRTTRVSAREAGGAMQGSLSRFQKIAQTIDMQAFQPMAMMMAANVQQFMEQDTYVKVSGDWPETYLADLQDQDGRIQVSPFDLMVGYDILPTDGRIPGSEDPQTWTQLYQIAASNPEIAQTMDMVKIFKHIARNLGAKNVDEFVVRTMPDEQIAEQEQQGNIVPDGQGQ